MKVGITAVGTYAPYYRMSREAIARAWERRALKGEKSIANTDEDSVTMAVEAARRCFQYINKDSVDSLFFASTTAPYSEKSHSCLIATACDLKENTVAVDFANSTKASASALKLAMNHVTVTGQHTIVTAADCRNGYPKSDQEQLIGDAAAAVAVGTENILAELVCSTTINIEIIDIWRNQNDPYINLAEGRFATDKGYMTAMVKAVKSLLKTSGISAEQISKAVFTTSALKDHFNVAKKIGIAADKIQEAYMNELGDTGNAQALFLLADALEHARPNEYILLASYGSGADAFLFKTTELVSQCNLMYNTAATTIADKKTFNAYGRFLSFRSLIEAQPGEPFRIFPSNAATWRDQKSILKLYGSVCKKCGTGTFPINRICPACSSKDEFEEKRFAERTASIFTYSIDNLAGRSDDPVVVQAVLEDSQGVRYYMNMTDFEKDAIEIGSKMEFVFRRIYEGAGHINYYWKCRPLRRGGK